MKDENCLRVLVDVLKLGCMATPQRDKIAGIHRGEASIFQAPAGVRVVSAW